jgi:hypothetical protein
MKSGAQIGVAVAAGYVLGRFHKMKWAMAIATMAGRKRLANHGVLQQGSKLLASSPELSKLTGDIRGSLVEAGKTAAMAAVGNRINSLSEGLRERSESMRAASLPGTGREPEDDSGREEDSGPEDGSGREEDSGPEDGSGREEDSGPEDDSGREDEERPRPRAEKRSRPAAKSRSSDGPGRSARRREPDDSAPRPKRRRPSDESAGQRSNARRGDSR